MDYTNDIFAQRKKEAFNKIQTQARNQNLRISSGVAYPFLFLSITPKTAFKFSSLNNNFLSHVALKNS